MATWGQQVTTSSGGNITLGLQGGYGTVTRNGRNVSFPVGLRMGMGSNISGTTSWSTNGFCAWILDGNRRYAKSGGSQSVANTWYYANSTSSSTTTSETTPVTWSGQLNGDVSSVQIGIGTSWAATNPTGSAYDYYFTVPIPTAAPVVNSINHSSVTRTSVYLSASVETYGAGITGGGWDVSTNGGSSWTYYGGGPTGATISNLIPNTQYWYRNYVTTGGGGANSWWGTFTTTGNTPTINSVAITPSRISSVLNPSVSYDTNASYSSISIQYGTTTSYGSTSTSSTISGLQPNTKYYYRMTVTDNWGRTSSFYTGDFTTTGNIPVINSVTPIPSRTECQFDVSVGYDTNASFKSVSIQYGLTTSYGNTSSNFNITGLQPNTTYYYRIVITDSWDRVSTAFTSSIKTTANPPIFITEEIANIGIEDAQLIFAAQPDLNTLITEYKLYDIDNILIDTNTTGEFDVIDLETDTEYSFYCIVLDNAGNNTQSNTLTFTTLTSKFIKKVNSDGNITEHNFYSIGEPKNFIKHIKLEDGGIAFAVDRDYATACSYSTSTTSMRSELISIQHTTLRKYQALFIKSDFSWKLQYYNKNKIGVTQQTGGPGEGALITFSDIEGYYAIEVNTRDIDALKAGTQLWACGSDDLTSCMNNTYKIKKRLLKTDMVKVSNKMRYIDIGQNGSYVDDNSRIVELEVYDKNGTNIALGKTVTIKSGKTYSNEERITNGNRATTDYCNITGRKTIAQVDLGQEYEVDYVRLWRYYQDNRFYKETFLYGRNVKKEICYKFHDWKRDGEYQETSNGLYVIVNNAPIDTSAPIINSFTANTLNWTNQGVTLTILAQDDFGTEDLIYSFDGGINWTKKNYITVFKNDVYTAIARDKAGNVSTTNPTINVENIDLVPPTKPYIQLRYDNLNGNFYDGNWTNRDICIDIKTETSPNKCPNDMEIGYIDKVTGEDIADNHKIRLYSKIVFSKDNDEIYIGRYGDISKVATIYFYNTDNEYLGYVDMLANIKDNIVNVPEGSHYARIADTSSHINNYYMVVEDNEVVPYEPYYVVYDDLSGIKGWYYKTSPNSDDYLPIIPGTIINQSSNFKWYVVTQDNAGNNSVPEDIEIKIDKESPINPRFGYTKTISSLTITASGTDEYSGIRGYKFSIDKGQNWTNEQQSNQYTFNDLNGMYNVMIKIIDMAGNEANSNFQAINIGTNTDFPVITGVLGNPIDWTKEDVELTINAAIGSGSPLGTTIVEYSFDNGVTWSSLNKQIFENNQLVHMMVKDSNGKTSETYLSDIIKIDKMPPSLTIPTEEVTISIGVDYDLTVGVSYYDNESGINEDSFTINPENTIGLGIGENIITYSVSDNAGNSTVKTRIINVEGLVPSDDLYPRDDLYPEDLPYSNSKLEIYTHRELGYYTYKQIKGGSL